MSGLCGLLHMMIIVCDCRLLQGSDSKNSHVVYGQDVEIFASRASCISQPTTGSSKVA